jgi:metallo-beta-lactamase class B
MHLKTPILICLLLVTLHSRAQKLISPSYTQAEWSYEYEPYRIAGNLYYVGTYDLSSYLVTTPEGHILINTGLPGSDTMIRAHIEKLGFKYSDIKILLTTHAHYDHVGAMAAIKKDTKAKMMIIDKDARALGDGGNSDYALGGKGITFIPIKADKLLHDHEIVKLGGIQLEVLHHPGHTPGASSFLFTVKDSLRSYRVLIANMPSILDETHFPSMPTYPNVGKDYAYTLEAMKKLKFDIWLSSHAAQFNMHRKHKPGDPYKPEVFFDQKGYDTALDNLYKVYLRKTNAQQ